MPPKKDAMRELVSQLLYACGGDTEQYEQTIDATLGAIEYYITQLAQTAHRGAPNPSKITPDDVLKAISNDPVKHSHVSRTWDDLIQKQKEKEHKNETGL
ncbi:hypothetical protein GPJ56_002204 [Histomonas meleagridis]|uniref:uncharacterized protein n=1 Tax=Histomonas meleagridis TaxID=135588 RepID=UPI0035594E89|nr:hypothetical protein GPJ56_002204 [Histomonas meleagridis]KAH0796151.1 hypothetical protein GO595_011118 [Histomonas meleagridis]